MSARSDVRRCSLMAPAFALTIALAPALACAQTAGQVADTLFSSKFAIDDADPSRAIPGSGARDEAPLDFAYFLMNLSQKAEAAEKRHDRAAQIRYLRAIAGAVPNRSIGFSRLCAAYEAAGQLAEAELSCAVAITLAGTTPVDFARYVRAVFGQQGDLSAAQLTNLNAVAEHLRREAPDSPTLLDIECQLAIRTRDPARYHNCTALLRRLPDTDVKQLSYRWAWAMAQGDYREAGWVMRRAEHSTLPSELLARMVRLRSARLPWWQRAAERLHIDLSTESSWQRKP